MTGGACAICGRMSEEGLRVIGNVDHNSVIDGAGIEGDSAWPYWRYTMCVWGG